MKKIFIDGKDSVGWSVDQDRKNLINRINSLNGFQITKNYFEADIIHNIWWNTTFNRINRISRFFNPKKVVLTASNFIELNNPKYEQKHLFDKASKFANAWISPSFKQKKIFENRGINSFYLPFLVPENSFYKTNESREEIAIDLMIDPNKIKNRVIISSFQRDTLPDLKTPKWQKNPQGLIEILKKIPRHSFVLLLCGPRRHFIRNECIKNNIPFIFYGKNTEVDDLHENNIDKEIINKLYNLSDIYLVSSLSEGGPKAILESILTKTIVFSTDVGLSSDFLSKEFIIGENMSIDKDLINLSMIKKIREKITSQNLKNYKLIYSKYDRYLLKIYNSILNEV